jgi:pimeloyl-ACP methyl ester carboxylesterase
MKEGDKCPVVIFSHGFDGFKRDFRTSAKYYAGAGICGVCHGFCGGGRRDEVSGLSTTEMNHFTEMEDLISVIDEVTSWDWIDETKVFLLGSSMGGLVSAMTAEKLKDRIDMVHVKDFGICESGGFACDSGINVKHVDFGTGNAKLEKMLCLLYKNNPDVPYVVEVHNEMPPMDDVVGACDFTDKVWEKCKK